MDSSARIALFAIALLGCGLEAHVGSDAGTAQDGTHEDAGAWLPELDAGAQAAQGDAGEPLPALDAGMAAADASTGNSALPVDGGEDQDGGADEEIVRWCVGYAGDVELVYRVAETHDGELIVDCHAHPLRGGTTVRWRRRYAPGSDGYQAAECTLGQRDRWHFETTPAGGATATLDGESVELG